MRECRKAPQVAWRLDLPKYPSHPEVPDSARKQARKLQCLVALVVGIIGGGFMWYVSSNVRDSSIAVMAAAIISWVALLVHTKEVFPKWFYDARGTASDYAAKLNEYDAEVRRLCDEAAEQARQLLFPLCYFQYLHVSGIPDDHWLANQYRVWWRTGPHPEDIAQNTFKVQIVGGNDMLVRFPECGYYADGRFAWGEKAVVYHPSFL